jgi:hypothetical protein
VNAALPLPVPDAVVVSIHETLLAAVHAHAAALAVTASDSVPPAADIGPFADAIVNLHTPASCETTTCASLTPTIALRGVGSTLAATWYVRLPLPWPEVSEVSAIHAAVLDAVQVQSRVVSMAMVPFAPSAGAEVRELVAETWHLGAVGAVTSIDDDPQADATIAVTSTTNGAHRVQTDERVLIRAQAAVQIDCLRPGWSISCAAYLQRQLDRSLVAAAFSF